MAKQSWSWVDKTEPSDVTQEHIDTVYRVRSPVCTRETCRGRNHSVNPNCLINLGEKQWLHGQQQQQQQLEIGDPNLEKRTEKFVGLKNLGATCYVNTLLQVWFHNLKLRSAIYQYRSTEEESPPARPLDPGGSHDPSSHDPAVSHDPSPCPRSPLWQLQKLFALLQASERRYIDPSDFVHSLGLDTGLQQDAQEFCQLFLGLMEKQFSSQYDPSVKNIIQSQFQGKYTYITECSGCKVVSRRLSTFYELDLNIKGHSDLDGCINEYLQEEQLEGVNQYYCNHCCSKNNALRHIQLTELSPVLNIQLLRFIFDRKTGRKNKLNTYIVFPEILDMSQYLGQEEGTSMYELTAVLIHRGVTAYSGHYIAHIKHTHTETWYKFNDEDVQLISGKQLKLGNDDDLQELSGKLPKRPRLSKGYHSTRNAYMLVYNHVNSTDFASEEPDIPTHLQTLVSDDNSVFTQWLSELQLMIAMTEADNNARQQEVLQLYHKLSVHPGDNWEWMSSDWLKKWLSCKTETMKLDNSQFMCRHNNLDPDKVQLMKRVRSESADIIHTKHPCVDSLKRLNSTNMCRPCVVEQCTTMRIRSQLNQDQKTITNLTKQSCQSDYGYWVGKKSLKFWKEMAFGSLQQDGTSTDHGVNGDPSSAPDSMLNHSQTCTDDVYNNSAGLTENRDAGMGQSNIDYKFNDDIVCIHGNLSSDDTIRRLISDEVWSLLLKYFPDTRPLTHPDVHPCMMCTADDEIGEQNEALNKVLASEQRGALTSLFQDRNRPVITEHTTTVFVINKTTVEAWRTFIRQPLRHSPIYSINNKDLLCPHDRLMYSIQPDQLDAQQSNMVTLLWPSEWEIVKKSFHVDREIHAYRHCHKTPPQTQDSITSPNRGVTSPNRGVTSPNRGTSDPNRGSSDPNRGTSDLNRGSSDPNRGVTSPNRGTSDLNRGTSDPNRGVTSHTWVNGSISLINSSELQLTPELCVECYMSRLEQQQRDELLYSSALIYVRKVAPLPLTTGLHLSQDGPLSTPPDQDSPLSSSGRRESSYENDPDYAHKTVQHSSNQGSKRQPTTATATLSRSEPNNSNNNNKGTSATGSSLRSQSLDMNNFVRRSSRHRRQRDEKQLTVNSSQTVKDLKIQILSLFSVVPMDQHLFVNGRELTQDSTTLASALVLPGSVIELVADEPCQEQSDLFYQIESCPVLPEEGFKGTGLMS